MADPVGTIGAPKAESDLNLIYQGGSNFMARLNALTAVKDAHDAAYERLQIGNDIAAARADAATMQADAASKQVAAAKVLSDAEAKAASIVADAMLQASSIIRDAKTKAASISDAADSMKSGADAYAAKIKSAADAALKDAQDAKDAAVGQYQQAQQAIDDHLKAVTAANTAHDAALQTQDMLEKKLARLQAVLAELTA